MKSHKKNTMILLIAGEVSGDDHASALVRDIKKSNPQIEFFGIGGETLAKKGMHIFYHIDQMAFLGVGEIIKHLPFIRKVHNEIVTWAMENKPSCAILVDYPGFNLRIAKSLKKLSIPVVYYISPKLWAWGKGRVKKIRQYVDKMIVVFPFEKKFYANYGIEAEFVGNPIIDKHSDYLPNPLKKIEPGKVKLGLLPGSRKQEVVTLLPKMIETARALHKSGNIQSAEIIKVENLPQQIYKSPLKKEDDFISILQKPLEQCLPQFDAVIVASGTATLECGLYQVPMLIVYHVNSLTYFLAKLFVKLEDIGLVNIVAEKQVAVELIQHQFTIAAAEQEIRKLLSPKVNLEKRGELKVIRQKLGEGGASEKAAHIVLDLLKNEN